MFGILDVEAQSAVNGNPRKARQCLESKPQTRKILPGNLPFKAHPPDFLPMESMNIFTVVSLCVCISCTGAFQVSLKPGKCRHRLKRLMSHSFWMDKTVAFAKTVVSTTVNQAIFQNMLVAS